MSFSDLQKSLQLLGTRSAGFEPLGPVPSVGARPGRVSTAPAGSSLSGSTDRSAKLEESDAGLREHHPSRTITTTDGLFTLEVRPIKRVVLVNGGEIVFKAPPA